MSDLKQFTGRRTSAQEHMARAFQSGLARVGGTHGPSGGRTNPDGTEIVFWMPGFVPLEYLRAENRARLGVAGPDPVLGGTAALVLVGGQA
jgi:hypothetical protein